MTVGTPDMAHVDGSGRVFELVSLIVPAPANVADASDPRRINVGAVQRCCKTTLLDGFILTFLLGCRQGFGAQRSPLALG